MRTRRAAVSPTGRPELPDSARGPVLGLGCEGVPAGSCRGGSPGIARNPASVSRKWSEGDGEGRQHEACCASDGGRPPGLAEVGGESKPPQAAAVKSRGGERCGKRPATSGSGMRREDEHVRTTADASKIRTMASKPGLLPGPGTKARGLGVSSARGCPACCPGGARCIGGVSSSQALAWNGRTLSPPDCNRSKWVSTAPRWREGDPQAARTARGRVPGGTGADRPVVAMKAL